MWLRSEDGVGGVKIGRILQRIIGAVSNCHSCDNEGYDAEIENGHQSLSGGFG